MISVQDVRVAYGEKEVLHGVSFSIKAGSIAGYVGPNGAGKTTTMRLLTGQRKPDSGRVFVAGIDVAREPLEAKRLFGFVPEHGHLYESFTPEEYLLFVARLHEMDESLAMARIEALLRYWGLAKEAQFKMNRFSKGMRQKVLVSAALLHDPQVLLMDEPLNGLDAEAVLQVRSLLREWAAAGKTVFYSSHILDAVEKVADQVIVIRDGHIIGDGTSEELKTLTAAASLESAFSHLTSTEDMAVRTQTLMAEAFGPPITI
jgi:ABC-2 type transport system ATP-binding protein